MPMAGKLTNLFRSLSLGRFRLSKTFYSFQRFMRFSFKTGYWAQSCARFGHRLMFYCEQLSWLLDGALDEKYMLKNPSLYRCTCSILHLVVIALDR